MDLERGRRCNAIQGAGWGSASSVRACSGRYCFLAVVVGQRTGCKSRVSSHHMCPQWRKRRSSLEFFFETFDSSDQLCDNYPCLYSANIFLQPLASNVQFINYQLSNTPFSIKLRNRFKFLWKPVVTVQKLFCRFVLCFQSGRFKRKPSFTS